MLIKLILGFGDGFFRKDKLNDEACSSKYLTVVKWRMVVDSVVFQDRWWKIQKVTVLLSYPRSTEQSTLINIEFY